MPPELSLECGFAKVDPVRDFIARMFGEAGYRVGDMQGRSWPGPAGTWERERRTSMSVIILRLHEPVQPTGGPVDSQHVWWSTEALMRNRRSIYPPGVVTLVSGYLDGWLPPGELRLE
nr:hypothetical protein KitaXyl93_42590 [Kitasatospora sp. Xyl93]